MEPPLKPWGLGYKGHFLTTPKKNIRYLTPENEHSRQPVCLGIVYFSSHLHRPSIDFQGLSASFAGGNFTYPKPQTFNYHQGDESDTLEVRWTAGTGTYSAITHLFRKEVMIWSIHLPWWNVDPPFIWTGVCPPLVTGLFTDNSDSRTRRCAKWHTVLGGVTIWPRRARKKKTWKFS